MLIWLIGALILASLEMFVGEFTLLMLAGGALAGAGTAALGGPQWASVAAFALVSLGLMVFLRPWMRKRLSSPQVLDTSHKALEGQNAEVIEAVGATRGQVRLDGTIWSARAFDPATTFAPGELVNVLRIDGGTTAIVVKKI